MERGVEYRDPYEGLHDPLVSTFVFSLYCTNNVVRQRRQYEGDQCITLTLCGLAASATLSDGPLVSTSFFPPTFLGGMYAMLGGFLILVMAAFGVALYVRRLFAGLWSYQVVLLTGFPWQLSHRHQNMALGITFGSLKGKFQG